MSSKSSNAFRVLGIGDPVTEAIYLAEEQRYINLIGPILTERTGRPIEIINAGVGGYNSWQELELIKKDGYR